MDRRDGDDTQAMVIGDLMEPPTDTASLHAQIAYLQAELDSLRERYDTLLEAKNRAAEHYKADFKKWRDFKRWLFHDAETDDHVKSFLKSGELVAYTRTSALGKRKQFEDFGPNLVDAEEDVHETEDHKQESTKVDHLPLAVVAPRHQRRKSYHGESSNKVLSPSPDGNKDPFLVPQSPNRDDKSSVLNHKSGGLPSSFETAVD